MATKNSRYFKNEQMERIEQVKAQRAYVLREFAARHIKSAQAIELKKKYDAELLKLNRKERKKNA